MERKREFGMRNSISPKQIIMARIKRQNLIEEKVKH